MSQSLKRALFSALLVILVSYPILGLKLRTVGIKLEVLGADAQTLWTIAAAALAMFVWQLFRDRIPLKLGRGVGYKVNGSGLKNFLSLPSTSAGRSSPWSWWLSSGRSSPRAGRWTSPP